MSRIAKVIAALIIVIGIAGIVQQAHAEENGDQRYLTMLVREAVSQRDYERARRLAVTTEHYDMIDAARRADREAELRAQSNRPQVVIVPSRPAFQPIPIPDSNRLRANCTAIGNHVSCY